MAQNDAEGLEMSCRSLLRRLEIIAGAKLPLHVADGPHLELAKRVAESEGWELSDLEGAKAMVAFDPDTEIGAHDDGAIDFVATVGKPAAAENSEFEFAAKRDFKRYASLNHVVGTWAEGKVPVGLRKLVASVSKALGFDTHVGARMAGVGVKGCEEWILARRGVDRPAANGVGDFWVKAVASFFGTGHIPLAGATLASLFTVILALPTWKLLIDNYATFWWIWFAVMVVSTFGCVVTEKAAGRIYLAKDPREVVLDETAGMAMTLLFLPPQLWEVSNCWAGLLAFIIAFFAFRFFDVLKIGVRWVERLDWPGSIVWDDLVAGIYAGLVTLGSSFVLIKLFAWA